MANLPIEYSSKPVTPFGGVSLMKRFVDSSYVRAKADSLRDQIEAEESIFNLYKKMRYLTALLKDGFLRIIMCLIISGIWPMGKIPSWSLLTISSVRLILPPYQE